MARHYGTQCEGCSGEDCCACSVYLEAQADDKYRALQGDEERGCPYCGRPDCFGSCGEDAPAADPELYDGRDDESDELADYQDTPMGMEYGDGFDPGG